MTICRSYLSWLFAVSIYRSYLPWEFAVRICGDYLPWVFCICKQILFSISEQILFIWKQTFFRCERNFFICEIIFINGVPFCYCRGSYRPPYCRAYDISLAASHISMLLLYLSLAASLSIR